MRSRIAGRSLALALGKYGTAAAGGAQNRIAYAADMLGSAISYGFFVFVFINLWGAVFAGKGTIAGYTAASATWYFAVAELVLFCSGGAFFELAAEVKGGAIAYALTRPFGYVLYQFATKAGAALAELLLLGTIGCAMGLISAGPLPIAGILHVPAVLLSLALAFSLSYLLQAAISLTAFWFEENSAFFWIYQKVILIVGTLMPLEFLPDGLADILRWTPFPYVAYAPARIAVAFGGGTAGILAMQAAWVAVMACVVKFVYARGVKRVSVQGG